MLRWLSLIYLILSVIGLSMLMNSLKISEGNHNLECYKENECPSIAIGMRGADFWLLFIMATCSTTSGLYIGNSFKTFGNIALNDDKFLAIFGSVGSIFNGSFRYIWAQIMDNTSFKSTYLFLSVLQTGLLASIYYIADAKILYLFWVSLILACEGGNFTLFPTIIANFYGKK